MRAGRPQTIGGPAYLDDDVLLSRLRASTWVELPTVPYAFRSSSERKQLGLTSTMSLAKLRKGPVHLKVRHVDARSAAQDWRDARAAHVARYGDPAPGYGMHLAGAEARMAQVQPFTKQVFLGFELGRRSLLAQARDLAQPTDDDVNALELAKWAAGAAKTRSTLARGALHARPLGGPELLALRRRTVWRGLTPPPMTVTGRRSFGRLWTADEFADVDVVPVVFTTVDGPRTCLRIDSPVGTSYTMTAVGAHFPLRMEFPAAKPWVAHVDSLPFPVEVDLLLNLVPPRQAKARFTRRLDLARDQERDAAFADADLPIETELMIELAREWEHKIPTRRLPTIWGHVTFRLDGASPAELADRYEVLRDHYGALAIDLEWPGGMAQRDLLTQAIPGFERAFSSYRQVWPVETVGCSLPTAGSRLGHRTGSYAGYSTGDTRSAVAVDQHWAIRRSIEQGAAHVEDAGGFVLLGKPRAGKSNALGTMMHEGALAGMPAVGVDFGGQLARLATVPDLAGLVQVSDLLQAGSGSADPMGESIIPGNAVPPHASCRCDECRTAARVRAARERLTFDSLRLLAWRSVDADPNVRTALQQSIQRVSRSSERSTGAVVADLLRQRAGAPKNLGAALAFDLDTDEGGVLVGEGSELEVGRRPLTILTGQGIQLADPGKPLSEWTPAELFGGATFGIVATKAHQLLWSLPPGTLSTLYVDECHVALATIAGKRILSSSLRNGPKRGVATVMATHNAEEVSADWLASMVSTWLLFRTTSPSALAKALDVMRVEASGKTPEIVRGFENGECLAVFPDDARDRFQWDRWRADTAAALNTTAGEVVPA